MCKDRATNIFITINLLYFSYLFLGNQYLTRPSCQLAYPLNLQSVLLEHEKTFGSSPFPLSGYITHVSLATLMYPNQRCGSERGIPHTQ